MRTSAESCTENLSDAADNYKKCAAAREQLKSDPLEFYDVYPFPNLRWGMNYTADSLNKVHSSKNCNLFPWYEADGSSRWTLRKGSVFIASSGIMCGAHSKVLILCLDIKAGRWIISGNGQKGNVCSLTCAAVARFLVFIYLRERLNAQLLLIRPSRNTRKKMIFCPFLMKLNKRLVQG